MIIMLPQTLLSQQDTTTKTDTIISKEKYGLRLGGDVSKLVRSFADKDYKGFEVNADYRLTKKVYLAGELMII